MKASTVTKDLSTLNANAFLSPSEIALWVDSPYGQACINRLRASKGNSPFEYQRKALPVASASAMPAPSNVEPWRNPATIANTTRRAQTKQAIALASIPVTSPKDKRGQGKHSIGAVKQSDALPVTPRALLALEPDTMGAHSLSIIQGGSFDVPLFESKAALEHSACPKDELLAYVELIGIQAASRAIRKIEGGKLKRGGREAIAMPLGRSLGVSDSGHERVTTIGAEWAGGATSERKDSWGATSGGGIMRVSDASKDDALSCAMLAAFEAICALEHGPVQSMPQRLASESKLSAARRRWVYIRAYNAAFRSLTTLQGGFTGDRTSAKVKDGAKVESVSTPEEWGRLASGVNAPLALVDGRFALDLTGDISDLDRGEWLNFRRTECPDKAQIDAKRATYRKARAMAWQALGAVWGLPSGNAGYNTRTQGRAIRRKFRILCLILKGEGVQNALERVGAGAMAFNGQLSKVLSLWTVRDTKTGKERPMLAKDILN